MGIAKSINMRVKIANVQVNPVIGQLENNIKKVKNLLKDVNQVDFVILPELAITGYNFASRESILPFLENATDGKSVSLAKEISNTYKCFTLIGYPEIFENTIYNSAVLVSPSGSILYNYRKTFLYETDKVWGCSENPEKTFKPFNLILDKEYYLNPQKNKKYSHVTTNFGICMDLNPYEFKAAFNEFELSMSCFANKAKLILCPMAWLSPFSPSIDDSLTSSEKLKKAEEFQKYFKNSQISSNITPSDKDNLYHERPSLFDPEEPDYSTINYWILRFFPFINHINNGLEKYFNKTTLVACNRVGLESDVLYGGSSSIIQFKNVPGNIEYNNKNPSVEIIGSLGLGTEGVLVREVDIEVD